MKNFLFAICALLFISNVPLDAQVCSSSSRRPSYKRHSSNQHNVHKNHRHNHVIGSFVSFLPGHAVVEVIRGRNYYVCDGNYFTRSRRGYRCEQAPSAYCAPEIISIPYDACEIRTSCGEYYISNGVFYEQRRHGVRIVDTPVGSIVKRLPHDYVVLSNRGHVFMESHGVYFSPVGCGRRTEYQVLASCPTGYGRH